MNAASDDLATLRRLRLDRDLSYAQLGALIGLRRQTIFRLLTEADARPNDRTAYKITKFLNGLKEEGADYETTGPSRNL